MIAVPIQHAVTGCVVVAAKHVTHDQHAHEQKEPERAERDIDEHPRLTLHPPAVTVNVRVTCD